MIPYKKAQARLPEILLNNRIQDEWHHQRPLTSPALNVVEKENGIPTVEIPLTAKDEAEDTKSITIA